MKKFPLILCVLALCACALSGCKPKAQTKPIIAQEEPVKESAPFEAERSVDGVELSWDDYLGDDLKTGRELLIKFPTAMVAMQNVLRDGQPSPLQFSPAVRGRFTWDSPSSGVFLVEVPPKPGVPCRVTLKEGLKDLKGEPVSVQNWGYEFAKKPFIVETEILQEFSSSVTLSDHPVVRVNFSHPVTPQEVEEMIYFQDRLSRKRFPVSAVVNETQPKDAPSSYLVQPREALPAERDYRLIVEAVHEVVSGTQLPYLRVFNLGQTERLKVDYVMAVNQPVLPPHIRIAFDRSIDPATATQDAIQVVPSVQNMKLEVDGPRLLIHGDFDLKKHYVVTIGTQIQGLTCRYPATQRGKSWIGNNYARTPGISKSERWGATFRAKRPAVVMNSESPVFMRNAEVVTVPFVQVNTGELQWQVAQLSLNDYSKLGERIREFEQDELDANGTPIRDSNTGEIMQKSTSLLIPENNLKVIASGQVAASGDDLESKRELQWKPQKGTALYLVEISGKDAKGRVVGNRLLVALSDYSVAWKRTAEQAFFKLSRFDDSKPAAGLPVRIYLGGGSARITATCKTDEHGLATLGLINHSDAEYTAFPYTGWILIGNPGEESVINYNGNNNYYDYAEKGPRELIFTDRNLYRPGETIKIHGILRDLDEAGKLKLPEDSEVSWSIKNETEAVASGDAKLSPLGSWDAEWTVPKEQKTGYLYIAGNGSQSCNVQVEEYRTPLFSVTATEQEVGTNKASIHLQSAYFHGAANAGAKVRWKAEWVMEDWGSERMYQLLGSDMPDNLSYLSIADSDSPDSSTHGFTYAMMDQIRKTGGDVNYKPEALYMDISQEGTAVLDKNGEATIECSSPFLGLRGLPRATVYWRADVISLEGQTYSAGAQSYVQASRAVLATDLNPKENGKGLAVRFTALDATNSYVAGIKTEVEVMRVDYTISREKLSANVARYVNVPQYETIFKTNLVTEAKITGISVSVKRAGDYISVVRAAGNPGIQQVSAATSLAADDLADSSSSWKVSSDTGLDCVADNPLYHVGDVARFVVKAPEDGHLWVTVEDDQIRDQFSAELASGNREFTLPIKADYAPNVFVSFHYIAAAHDGKIPAERKGECEIKVERSEAKLTLVSNLEKPDIHPGQEMRGTVQVTQLGKPVSGAEVVLFAVDDALLQLGGWKLPDAQSIFFPRRSHNINQGGTLANFQEQFEASDLVQKGFILGGGDMIDLLGNTSFRKDFRPLAYWNSQLRSDAKGQVSYSFKVPDSLTRYRVVAVALSGTENVGSVEKTFTVSKELQVEPALPRFVREGDHFELRAVVRWRGAAADRFQVNCVASDGLKLEGDGKAEVQLEPSGQVVVRFPCVAEAAQGSGKVRFSVQNSAKPAAQDAVEISLPLKPHTLVRRVAVSGNIPSATWAPAQAALPQWKGAPGSFDLLVSGCSWMPKLAGLPVIIEYPHGCFEQISSRVLALTLCAGLLDFLPDSKLREVEYQKAVESALKKYEENLGAGKGLPYWPGGSGINPYVTVQAGWSVISAQKAGLQVPEALKTNFVATLKNIAQRKGSLRTDDTTRALALYVLSSEVEPAEFSANCEQAYLHRENMGDEGRAFLALAMSRLKIMPDAVKTMLSEIDKPAQKGVFDPQTFRSDVRAEAVRLLARNELLSAGWRDEELKQSKEALLALLDSSEDLSTQENLWLLLAFQSLVKVEINTHLKGVKFSPAAEQISANGQTVAWVKEPLQQLEQNFSKPLGISTEASYLLRVDYQDEQNTAADAKGIALERSCKNLTDSKRDGSDHAPFHLGDELLISYRVKTERDQSYVALEDPLPSCMETVNPNLAQIAETYHFDQSSDYTALDLSHVERRDEKTDLFFDALHQGKGTYSVVARVTSVGAFYWPGAKISPMYDARFYGTSLSGKCWVAEEK